MSYEPLKNITTVQNDEFRDQFKKWLNNKLILSRMSAKYKINPRKDAITNIKGIFGQFLLAPTQYNIGQLALLIKRHEDLLLLIVPVPNNPSYQTALNTLSEIIEHSQRIITSLNLQHLL